MNTSKTNAHTPGPWEIFPVKEVWRGHDVRGPHGETITHVQRGDSERDGQHAANARLIAAAPNMLKALKCCIRELSVCHAPDCSCIACNTTRAVIASATGRG